MLTSKCSNIDIEYHLQAATKAFYANKHVSICKRLRYFHTVVTPVACFGAGPRAIHGVDLSKIDVHFRNLVRNIVGPPPQTNWDSPWHIILHAWNERVNYVVQQSGIPTWTTSCLQQHWRFARYIANLPAKSCKQMGYKRVLHWTPMGNATVGRPRIVWESKIQGFCRYKLLGNWLDLAKGDVWIDMIDDFVGFCFPHQWRWRCICFNFRLLCHFRLRPKDRHEMKWKFSFHFVYFSCKFICLLVYMKHRTHYSCQFQWSLQQLGTLWILVLSWFTHETCDQCAGCAAPFGEKKNRMVGGTWRHQVSARYSPWWTFVWAIRSRETKDKAPNWCCSGWKTSRTFLSPRVPIACTSCFASSTLVAVLGELRALVWTRDFHLLVSIWYRSSILGCSAW